MCGHSLKRHGKSLIIHGTSNVFSFNILQRSCPYMRVLDTPSLWPKFIDGCCNPYVFKPNHCKRRRAKLASIYTPAKLKDGRRDPCLILLTFRQVKQCCVISFTNKSIFLFLLVAILKFITLWPHQSMRKLYKKNS